MLWWAIIVGSAGCYLLKLAGLSVPERILQDTRVQKIAALLPIGLLTALLVIQAATTEHRIVVDERLAGIAAAWIALLLRAPFLVVVAVAAATTATLRVLL
ncbi:AzlD domain-containing protein [Nocardia sp. CDC160]|uniref:AzlD domain-containing protein n=1 Tax=Nocardia sp. CDC160 TaxID=3112166 RepID=UPI002DB9ECF1|nr:AzlD domain-containing protein [Nocardia sp. CDC160]MEC3917282.1 AzlD domain-containing protein [Nocardia sp. CDC160]